nr:MAG TPA: hypothetical protein [Caudoviricetes sp.]
MKLLECKENKNVREIKFDGKSIVTVLIGNKVYVSIKSICKNLGMDKNLSDTQIKKINKDELLKGASKLTHLKTNGGTQQVLMIELDYLPIWLAKINPSRFTEELKEQLLNYQLRAKDVLADEFLGKRKLENKVRYEPELNEIEDRSKRIRKNQDIVRSLLIQIANDYDWIKYRAGLGFQRAKFNYKESKRTAFILEGKELTIEDIDKLNTDSLKRTEKELNEI